MASLEEEYIMRGYVFNQYGGNGKAKIGDIRIEAHHLGTTR
jgi:hypothetical protein